jgi:nitrate/nitrite transporter NarK
VAARRRELLLSKGWVQAVVLVVLFGFFVLGLLAYRTYQAKPPIPERVVDPAGELLYTERDVERGQEVFLNNGLMEYGSVFGHGAYLGPDYTADYLRRASNHVERSYGGERSDRAARRTIVIAVMLVALAGLVAAVALARNHDPAEAGLLVGLLATCARWSPGCSCATFAPTRPTSRSPARRRGCA